MRVRLIAMVAVVTTTLVATGSAQQSIVRWGEHGQSSSTVSEDGEIGKHVILSDGRISASVRDGGHSLVIELQITNAGPVPVRAESTLVEFQVIRPQSRVLQRIESEALADRVRREGNGHAAAAEGRGSVR